MTSMQNPCKGGNSVLIMTKTLWKSNLNFVKDVPMIYVNFIITVIIVSEEKNRRYYFCTNLHIVLKASA